jgi:two-component system, chemotaxis family, response regulator Rcp1
MDKRILLIEDNPEDTRIIEEALKDCSHSYRLYTAANGEEALKRLMSKDFIRPSLIILDLYMPKIDGWTILEYLKSDSSMRLIPVMILTVSENHSDIVRAYKNMANCYIVKPSDVSQYKTILQSLCRFWFETVTLPELHNEGGT